MTGGPTRGVTLLRPLIIAVTPRAFDNRLLKNMYVVCDAMRHCKGDVRAVIFRSSARRGHSRTHIWFEAFTVA